MGIEHDLHAIDLMAEIEGRQRQSVVDVLMTHPAPLTIYSQRKAPIAGRGPAIVYFNTPHDGKADYVWLGNNMDREQYVEDEEIFSGVFRVDRKNTRVLYIPDYPSVHRDSYRAIGSTFTYDGKMVDMLSLLEAKGLTFAQVSSLNQVDIASTSAYPREAVHITIATGRAASVFEKLTGMSKYEAFQFEGERTLQEIRDNVLLPITILTVDDLQNDNQYIERLSLGWKV